MFYRSGWLRCVGLMLTLGVYILYVYIYIILYIIIHLHIHILLLYYIIYYTYTYIYLYSILYSPFLCSLLLLYLLISHSFLPIFSFPYSPHQFQEYVSMFNCAHLYSGGDCVYLVWIGSGCVRVGLSLSGLKCIGCWFIFERCVGELTWIVLRYSSRCYLCQVCAGEGLKEFWV